MTYVIILSAKYMRALIKAGAIGEENAISLESIGLTTHRFLNPLVWKKYLGVAEGNKVYVTNAYMDKLEKKKRNRAG